MKKIYFSLLLTLVLSLLSTTSFAYDAEIDGIYYNFSGTKATVTYKSTSYNSYSGTVSIPESVTYNGTTYSVTSIGDQAFDECCDLTSVTIPNGVTSIGDNAFQNCGGLTSVTIPNSVTLIEYNAFKNCSGLTSVTISNSVTSIESSTFSGCSSLTSVTIPSSVTSIGERAFEACSSLTSVTIPNSVTSIGSMAFIECSSLTSVTIPNSVTSIGYYAFSECSGLTSVVSEIETPFSFGSSAFNSISPSCSLTVPVGKREDYINKGWTTSVFNGGIIDLSEPDIIYLEVGNYFTAKTIEDIDMTFRVLDITLNTVQVGNNGCSINSGTTGGVTVSNKVVYGGKEYTVYSIGEKAFYNCTGLTSVTIPNSVTSIGSSAFSGCSGLTSVVSEIETPFTFGSSAFSSISSSCTLTVPSCTRDAYINKGWTTSVFKGGIIDLSEPDIIYLEVGNYFTAKTIEDIDMTFRVLDITLNTVQVGNNGCSINSGTTGGVTIPNKVVYGGKEYTVTTIGKSAFYGCSGLTSVTIGNSVTSIGTSAFYDCSGLTRAEFASIESLCNITFSGSSNPLSYAHHLYINGEEVTELVIPNSVTTIGSYAFYGCSGLTSVTIPNSVTSIGSNAFYGCSGLTSVTIGNSVTSIGTSAFYDCSGLTKAEFASIESLCNITFSGSSNPLSYAHHLYINGEEVTELVIPNSVTTIGSYAFYNCSRLTSVIIPNSVISIGSFAFYNCSRLTSVIIPNSVTSIGLRSFYGCNGLTSITIPNSVTSIGGYAFYGCSGLTSVIVDIDTPLTIISSTFSNRANATLYVPYGSKAAYEQANYWKEFKEIIEFGGPETCATPVLTYQSGKIRCSCETEGVKYVYSITPTATTGESSDGIIELGTVFTVSVHATREGFLDSEPATITIDLASVGDLNGDGAISIADVTGLVNVILGK